VIPGPEGVIETGENGGRLFCPLINVAFQLRDVAREDGASPFRDLWEMIFNTGQL
jgi:hypothetical protein